jgi:N-acetylglucosamine kinase
MSLILGIDGGGTKTVCVVMDDTGNVLARGEGGASNYQSVGIQAALDSIQFAIIKAVTPLGTVRIDAIGLGLAGVGRPRDIQRVQSWLQSLQSNESVPVIWALQPSNCIVCNDALIALVGGLGHGVGIVAIAGTGSIVFGRNRQGNTKRVGGWGHVLGDVGSAYHIAISGLRAAMRAYDGCDVATRLQSQFQEHLGLSNLDELVEVIYRQGWSAKDIAALAPIIAHEAASGDEVSMRIIADAINEFVQTTTVVIQTLFHSSEVVEIVTLGSVWQGISGMQQRFATSLMEKHSLVQVISPLHEPAYGAGLLALETLGLARVTQVG